MRGRAVPQRGPAGSPSLSGLVPPAPRLAFSIDLGIAQTIVQNPWKTVLVTKIVAVGAFGAFPLRIAVIFQADADFEVKLAVDSYS